MSKQEAEELTKVTFRTQKSLLKEVQHYAIENDMTDTQVFNDAVRAYMKVHKKGERA
jgi:hypothetical protein